MTGKQITTLYFGVRPAIVCKYTGQLLLIFSFFITAPLIFCLVVGEYGLFVPYSLVAAGSGLAGFLLQRIRAPEDIQNNETLVISALIFITVPLLVSLPFLQPGVSWIDAFFEAVSGITTTGLSNIPSVENLPRTFLFARAWLQWIGGLGFVVLSVAVLLPHSKATLQLFKQNWEQEGLIASTRAYARIILQVYLALTLTGFILLMVLGVQWFDAAAHVLAAVSTGGFSSYDDSLAGLGGRPAEAAVIILSLSGAIPLILYYLFFTQGWREFTGNVEVKGLAAAAVLAALTTSATLLAMDGLPLRTAVEDGTLLALSAQTTTGFSTLPVAGLSDSTKFVLILFMLIGGNVGSTAGGIKIVRLLVILKLIRFMIFRSGLPSDAVTYPRLTGRRLESVEIVRCFLLVFLFLLVIGVSWFIFILMGYPLLDSLFEVVSATCTVGLSTGISSSSLPAALKSVLCVDMLMGRLEIIAFLVLLYPSTWFAKKRGA
jgi:trk system potassium uptake protein